jgi:hypothetical protein
MPLIPTPVLAALGGERNTHSPASMFTLCICWNTLVLTQATSSPTITPVSQRNVRLRLNASTSRCARGYDECSSRALLLAMADGQAMSLGTGAEFVWAAAGLRDGLQVCL